MRASNRSACKKASNLLLTNRYSTITEVANMCGYSSQTSFIRAFKERFHMTPKDWRNGGYKEYSLQILRQSKKAMSSHATFDGLKPTIVKQPPLMSSIEKTTISVKTAVLISVFISRFDFDFGM